MTTLECHDVLWYRHRKVTNSGNPPRGWLKAWSIGWTTAPPRNGQSNESTAMGLRLVEGVE